MDDTGTPDPRRTLDTGTAKGTPTLPPYDYLRAQYELWKIPKGGTFAQDVQFALYDCPSALARGERREYAKGVPLDANTVPQAMAWGMSSADMLVAPEEWELLEPLVTES